MNPRQQKELKLSLLREVKIRKAKSSFWEFCKLLEPDFYKENRTHLKILSIYLQALYEGKLKKKDGQAFEKFMISLPPQHGKTRTLKNFCAWILGVNPNEIIGYACFAKDLAIKTSRGVKALIAKTKDKVTDIVYSDIFPETKLKRGHNTVQEWALEGRFLSFKTTSVEAQITGTGVTIRISDDLISGYREALNENAKDVVWDWWTGTYLSRRAGQKVLDIMCMTRWAEDDPCGRVQKIEPDNWYIVNLPVEKDNKMLCHEILTYDALMNLKKLQPEDVFFANYYQEPVDAKNRVFNPKFYQEHEISILLKYNKFDSIIATVDTADKGEDYLSCAIFGIKENFLYFLDGIYTQEGSEKTEPMVAELLTRYQVDYVRLESNNGGNVIGRNIESIMRSNYSYSCEVNYFHRTANKKDNGIIARGTKHARILAHSSLINNYILFPSTFPETHTEAYNELIKYNRSGKNKHDDFVDTLSMAIEVKEDGVILNYADIYK